VQVLFQWNDLKDTLKQATTMATLAVMDYMQVDNGVFLANTQVIEILLYCDSMGSLYIVGVFTKMTSFKETRDSTFIRNRPD